MTFFYQNEPLSEALVAAARQNPHQIPAVKLSKNQLKVLNAIKCGESVTAEVIAKRCDLSDSWASTLLKKLHERYQLTRTVSSRQTGGIAYTYKRKS